MSQDWRLRREDAEGRVHGDKPSREWKGPPTVGANPDERNRDDDEMTGDDERSSRDGRDAEQGRGDVPDPQAESILAKAAREEHRAQETEQHVAGVATRVLREVDVLVRDSQEPHGEDAAQPVEDEPSCDVDRRDCRHSEDDRGQPNRPFAEAEGTDRQVHEDRVEQVVVGVVVGRQDVPSELLAYCLTV